MTSVTIHSPYHAILTIQAWYTTDIPIPDGLHYLSALGLNTATAFKRAYGVCEKEEIKLLVIDSWGPLMDGDMESARDVIRFYNNHLKPFVDLGVTVLTVDHQARTQEGQNYQRKGAFGSVYKENLARSVLQIASGWKRTAKRARSGYG